jgi:predicted transcriptional regulator YdeE
MNLHADQKEVLQYVEREGFFVAATYYVGKNEHGEIGAMWDNQFFPRLAEIEHLNGGIFYGVSRMPPGLADGEFEYLAAVEVDKEQDLPQGIYRWEIPANGYVIMPAKGIPDLMRVMDTFYSKWLPGQTEYELAGDYNFEYYSEHFDTDQIIDVYFPVKKKQN